MVINEALISQAEDRRHFLGRLRQRSVALVIAGVLSPIAGGALVPSVSSASTYREAPSAVPLSSPDLLPGPDVNFDETMIVGSTEAEIATSGLAEAKSNTRNKSRSLGEAAAESHDTKKSCVQYLVDTMTPGQVQKAVIKPTGHTGQSIVGAAISTVREAEPAGRYLIPQPSNAGTEVDAYYRAKIGNKDELGTYVFQIYYKGKLAPKDVNMVEVTEIPSTFTGPYWRSSAQYLKYLYSFSLSRSVFGNDGLNWLASVNYGQKSNSSGTFSLSSLLANGDHFGKPRLRLTAALLTDVGSQFIELTKKAEEHRPLDNQPILPILKKEQDCSD